LDRLLGALLPKLKKIAPGFLANAVRKGVARIAKLSTIKTLDPLARSHAPAPVSHRGSKETTVDGGVAWCACLASYKPRAGSAGRNRKQQCQWKNQRAEYITAGPRKTINYEAASMAICESQKIGV
jgi:hypothetical protein